MIILQGIAAKIPEVASCELRLLQECCQQVS